ncbi:MAG: STAS domain-containing protein [Planctomycetaceae bacterium]|nr:STAS domain-containing protein [Planctomycetaceae bacterium]
MTINTNAFDVSIQRHAVVITPLGDTLSYREVDLQREAGEIKDLLKEKEVLRLVLDLGSSNYFGSNMIGMINSFGLQVKEQGGQMVICNASDDMEAILKVMKLDTLWTLYPTQAKAIKALRAMKG